MRTLSNAERRPKIAFSTWRRTAVVEPYGHFDLEAVGTDYLSAVQACGASVVLLPHGDPEDASDLLAGCDGLILVGGDDVDPTSYGENDTGASHATSKRSDAFEIALIQGARAANIPLLAICRGMQILNVALGGTLIQDLPSTTVQHRASTPGADGLPEADHPITVADDSQVLRDLYGSVVVVNSIHHQAIGRCAGGLRVVARASDGVIEAVESSEDGWSVVGVQWHPEKIENGAALFAWLVAQARAPSLPSS